MDNQNNKILIRFFNKKFTQKNKSQKKKNFQITFLMIPNYNNIKIFEIKFYFKVKIKEIKNIIKKLKKIIKSQKKK